MILKVRIFDKVDYIEIAAALLLLIVMRIKFRVLLLATLLGIIIVYIRVHHELKQRDVQYLNYMYMYIIHYT